MKTRIIRDTLWGDIDITDPVLTAIINMPVFQRLRRIRMTAFAQFSHPGLTGSRFEHSLGTTHLLRQECFNNRNLTFNEATEEQKFCTIIALCHHLTFFPLSYATQPFFDVIFDRDKWTKLNNIMAFNIYEQILKTNKQFGKLHRKFALEFLSYSLGRFSDMKTKPPYYMKIGVKNFRRLKDSIYRYIFRVPTGVNFIEAFCRDLHLSGIGRNFHPSLITHGLQSTPQTDDKTIAVNVNSAIYSLETAIDLVYNDEVSSMCCLFIQRILYATWNNSAIIISNDVTKPLVSFISKIRSLRNAIRQIDNNVMKINRDLNRKIVNLFLDIDDPSLLTALKKTLINIGEYLQIVTSSRNTEKTVVELNTLRKMIYMILYGGDTSTDFGLIKVNKPEKLPNTPADMLSFQINKTESPMQDLISQHLGVSKVSDLYYPVCFQQPSIRLNHYINNLEELYNYLHETIRGETSEIMKHTIDKIKAKYQDQVWLIYNKEYVNRKKGGSGNG